MIQSIASGNETQPSFPVSARSDAPAGPSSRNFQEIMSDYWTNEDRGSALAYLKSLSGSELRAVGREHGFADPTPKLYGLSIEGANNLLRARGETVDENRDGIDQIGEARTWRFPNSNTPESVKAAWDEATEGMDDGESMLLAGVLFMPLPQFETDASGRVTHVTLPGDPGYRSRMERDDFSYAREVENKLRSLDDPSNPPTNFDFYRKSKAFYQNLLESFERHGVA
ncbi:hypothetical protein [Pelagicoccus sp. SDUM812003]|uniref:hypothetical protein n=1 Tax=Pelagicoccus sp. SDUM812003 TaxID=3041267 RepID=UPI00280D8730|nr:hypothetical protein [Pelagicoccus sp. SDUM812003]MDQ8203181.1 hypothetical protein [Pelagicoccus sp. SDUM812003]